MRSVCSCLASMASCTCWGMRTKPRQGFSSRQLLLQQSLLPLQTLHLSLQHQMKLLGGGLPTCPVLQQQHWSAGPIPSLQHEAGW